MIRSLLKWSVRLLYVFHLVFFFFFCERKRKSYNVCAIPSFCVCMCVCMNVCANDCMHLNYFQPIYEIEGWISFLYRKIFTILFGFVFVFVFDCKSVWMYEYILFRISYLFLILPHFVATENYNRNPFVYLTKVNTWFCIPKT